MRVCTRCFKRKPQVEYTRAQGRCNECRAELGRFERLERAGQPIPIPKRFSEPFHFLEIFLSRYDGTEPLPIPVRCIGHKPVTLKACVLKPSGQGSQYHIAANLGARTLDYETSGPMDLIRNLLDLGLEVAVSEEVKNGQV